MLRKCGSCGRRFRLKAKCIEKGHNMCKKCCELDHEGCQYHLFCWNNYS